MQTICEQVVTTTRVRLTDDADVWNSNFSNDKSEISIWFLIEIVKFEGRL